ncbi:MAG: GTP 3',8-cyclase MoaA [Bacteroidota bacterium]
MLQDSFNRTINNLRISVTDRCNFRCLYCMPEEGMIWLKRDELLTFEEIERLARIFSDLGVVKIRLTGGEPLMRKDFPLLVKKISNLNLFHDIALTTNGYFLEEQAQALQDAGLHRITVSLDSLDPLKFSAMARRDYFQKVWKGLEFIDQLNFHPIKLNTVMIRGYNDNEIDAFAELARRRNFIVRFIEFMPIGADDGWSIDKVVPAREIIEHLNRTGVTLVPIESHGIQPADRFKFEDGKGEIGFISSVSDPFCGSCNRVRITSDGKFRTCLFSLNETDLKALLRNGADDNEIKSAIRDAVFHKEKGHLINQPGFVRAERTMSQIGG